MGAHGSTSTKVNIIPQLFHFTQYGKSELQSFFVRGTKDLSDTFALRLHEFEFLLNSKLVTLPVCRFLFSQVLDTDKNSLVDKMEIMCLVILCSSISNAEKVEFIFELFNFNGKGYLVESEMSLLVLSVTRVVAKVDSRFKAPPKTVWSHVIGLCFQFFAKVDKTGKSIRKPELVEFAAVTPQVTSYMDAFRGHASQVFVKMKKRKPSKRGEPVSKPQTEDGRKWVDAYFACNESAITPLNDWQTTGLPPYNFVRWRRRENIGSVNAIDGYPFLFSHERAVLRTLDKRKLYYGPGVIGGGHFQQGLLADRWVLNGLAVCLAKPQLVEALFGITGQEDTVGRFNVRVFEGCGWRGLFVDDRIPCSPQCKPLFFKSSDRNEAWPLIYEKALAKYLGSYGNISLCSKRMDATLTSLRMTTGGHCYREAVEDYEWKSVAFEVSSPEKDGMEHIRRILKEGSLISLGRSEGMAFHPLTFKDSPRVAPPHGYLYPVVVEFVDEQGYKFVKIRDAFHDYVSAVGETLNTNKDYQKDDRIKVDDMSGHCNTIKIPAERIPLYFDVMMVVRYPDALRPLTEKLGLQPWRTDYLKMRTRGKESPARFLLTVIGHAKDKDTLAENAFAPSERLSKLREAQANDVEVSDAIVSQEMNADFDYSRFRTFPTAEKRGPGLKPGHNQSEAQVEAARVKKEIQELLRPMDMCITVSSTCPWGVGGAPEVGATLRLRIVPSTRTIRALRVIGLKKEEIKKELLAKQAEELARQKALLAAEEPVAAPGAMTGQVDNAVDGKNPETGGAGDSEVSEEDEDEEEEEEKEENDDDEEEEDSDEESSEKETPYEQRLLEEEAQRVADIQRKERVLELEWFETRDSSQSCWISKSVQLYPGEYYILADVSYDLPNKKIFHLANPREKTECPWLDGRPLEVNKIWLQATSVSQFQIKALFDAAECPKHGVSLSSVTFRPSRWPFSAENQDETSSRMLNVLLDDLRTQIEVSGAKFLSYAQEFKNKFRHRIHMYKQHLDEEKEAKRQADERAAEIQRQKDEAEEDARQMEIYKAAENKRKKDTERKAASLSPKKG